jgi:hypothetical protein
MTKRSEAARKANATRKANKQAKIDRQNAIIDAFDERLTESARKFLTEAVEDIGHDWLAKVNAALAEANAEMQENLDDLARDFGWSLVGTVAGQEWLSLDEQLPHVISDVVWYDEEEEFKDLDINVETLNTEHPDTATTETSPALVEDMVAEPVAVIE